MAHWFSLPSLALGAAAATGVALLLTGRSRAAGDLGPADPPPGLPPGRVVAVPGHGELFVRDQPGPSDRPPVVLLHGWVASADLNWYAQYDALRGSGRVLAPDHRGHGRGARHSQPFRLVDVADDVAALLRHLEIGPAIVVGYSMGGPITQLVWHRHRDVVAGVVLCATAADFNFSMVTELGWRLMGFYQLGSRLLPRSWMERAFALSFGRPSSGAAASLLPWAVGEIQRADREDLAEAGRELSRFDSTEWLGDLDVPAAVVVTTRDNLVPPAAQRQMARLIPDARVYEVAADHDATATARHAFNDALVRAIDDLDVRLAVDGSP